MDFKTICQSRRSVHDFIPNQKISNAEFEAIMELVRLTPSGYNAQPWRFVLVRDDDRLAQVRANAFDQKHLTEAGNAVLVLSNRNFAETEHDRLLVEAKDLMRQDEQVLAALSATLKKERPEAALTLRGVRNTALAAMTFLYSAYENGWATCPMMGFSQRRLKALLDVPDGWDCALLIALGKEDTAKTPPRLPRKEVSEIAAYESFGGAI